MASRGGLKILVFGMSVILFGCASYNENGELVRHHFGYVKVITPAIHAPDAAVTSLEIETYGVWLNTDTRNSLSNTYNYGVGVGYQYDRRDFIPLDCRIVVRIKTKNEFNRFMELISHNISREEGICIIRGSNI